MTEEIDLTELKRQVERLPLSHPLRVVLGEPDRLSKEQYLAKAPIWFRLTLPN